MTRSSWYIDGVDHFEFSHDCAVIEGANTSFQFHLQVAPDEAGALYNLAQLITAPLLAVAANAPVLLNQTGYGMKLEWPCSSAPLNIAR